MISDGEIAALKERLREASMHALIYPRARPLHFGLFMVAVSLSVLISVGAILGAL